MIGLRRELLKYRQSLALGLTLLVLGIAVVTAHGAVGQEHMGMDGDPAVPAMCLAVLEIGVGVAAIVLVARGPAFRPVKVVGAGARAARRIVPVASRPPPDYCASQPFLQVIRR